MKNKNYYDIIVYIKDDFLENDIWFTNKTLEYYTWISEVPKIFYTYK